MLIVLGNDPAPKNYGWSVVKVWTVAGNLKYEVLACGKYEYPISKLTGDINSKVQIFLAENHVLINSYSPTAYATERFVNRLVRGTIIETTNLMMGLLSAQMVSTGCPVRLITSSTWKNAANLKFNLDKAYKVCKAEAHLLDATCIALYAAAKILEVEPFAFVRFKSDRDDLIRAVEEKSQVKLINRVARRVKKKPTPTPVKKTKTKVKAKKPTPKKTSKSKKQTTKKRKK